ncbi:Zinc knuckle [Popillia japonica]|uniref:Zinc knuckle n=1 Tax=Popillia japonica TaxID=7064 RepID=A0AAW1L9U4_POPJA
MRPSRDGNQIAIRDSLDSRGAQTIRVTSMRPSRDGNQIATVRTSRATGSILMKKGRIKIGWVGCRIRERVEVVRCFKCLEFGHRRKDCNGEDRSGLCLNCNQTGHQAKDCTSEQFCPSCREGGHRADSTKCQKFRELLKIRGIVKNQARRPITENPGDSKKPG